MGGRGGEVSPLGVLMGRGRASGRTMGLEKTMPAIACNLFIHSCLHAFWGCMECVYNTTPASMQAEIACRQAACRAQRSDMATIPKRNTTAPD